MPRQSPGDQPRPPRKAVSRAVTPIAFVRDICAAYHRYGMDPAAALTVAGISRAALDAPAGVITAAQMEAVSDAAMRELDDEALGWFSRRLPWGSYGLLCRASLTAPNLGRALGLWCRHHGLLTADVSLRLVPGEGLTWLTIHETPGPAISRELCLVTLLRYVHGFACWAVDSRIPLAAIEFPYAEPAHAEAYPLMFPGPVRFDSGRAGFACASRYLELPLVRDEPALRQMLKRALPLTVLQYRRDRLLVSRARDVLAAHLEDVRDAAALADHLHVSVRTLHRQLGEAGTSLQRLKDEVRRERALALLLRTRRPVKAIARAVGFDNEKSFARAFRQWTGQAPSAFRRREE
ncbi:MAG: AraC family transcriptional regulator [Gammaproteobacteria bacterium]